VSRVRRELPVAPDFAFARAEAASGYGTAGNGAGSIVLHAQAAEGIGVVGDANATWNDDETVILLLTS